jgi:hypothetical protein
MKLVKDNGDVIKEGDRKELIRNLGGVVPEDVTEEPNKVDEGTMAERYLYDVWDLAWDDEDENAWEDVLDVSEDGLTLSIGNGDDEIALKFDSKEACKAFKHYLEVLGEPHAAEAANDAYVERTDLEAESQA